MKLDNITLVKKETDSSNVYGSFSHPGLALPIIGTILRDAGYNVQIYVDTIHEISVTELAKSSLVGFSVNSACFLETYRCARQLRKISDAPIIFGGPHVSFKPEEALEFADFVVRGEGEETMLELVQALERNETDFSDIAGLSWRDKDNCIRHNPARGIQQDLSLIPDTSLIVGYRQHMQSFKQKLFPSAMLVSTSRGCPYQCTFCTIPQSFGQTMRYRDIDLVINDIRSQIMISGNHYIYFADDNFAIHRKRTKKMLQRFIDEGLDIRFSAQVRCEIARDSELMDLLKAAGAYLVFIGFESINDQTLQAFNKGGKQSRVEIERSIDEFQKRGIMVHGMFVVGSDTEQPGVALETARWAIDKGLDSLQILPICPLPGTEVLVQMEREGRLLKQRLPGTKRDFIPYKGGNCVIFKPHRMTAIQLQNEIMQAYRIFYNNRQLLRKLTQVTRKGWEPVVYQLMGRHILKIFSREMDEHLTWLGKQKHDIPVSLEPAMSATATSPY